MSSTRPRKPKEPEEPIKNPIFIPAGTEVTAKWDGAFCTANVVSMKLNLLLTVVFEDKTLGVHQVSQDDIVGKEYEVGSTIQAKHPDLEILCPGKIRKVKDMSEYVVLFSDGDMLNLDRSKVKMLGQKHFKEFTLNNFPIVDLKAFTAPVVVINGEPMINGRRPTGRNARRRNVSETITRPPEDESQNGQAPGSSEGSQRGQVDSASQGRSNEASNMPPPVLVAEGLGQRAENSAGVATATPPPSRQPSSWDALRRTQQGLPPKKRLRRNDDENNDAVSPPVLQPAVIPASGRSNAAASRDSSTDVPPSMRKLAERTGMTQAHLESLMATQMGQGTMHAQSQPPKLSLNALPRTETGAHSSTFPTSLSELLNRDMSQLSQRQKVAPIVINMREGTVRSQASEKQAPSSSAKEKRKSKRKSKHGSRRKKLRRELRKGLKEIQVDMGVMKNRLENLKNKAAQIKELKLIRKRGTVTENPPLSVISTKVEVDSEKEEESTMHETVPNGGEESLAFNQLDQEPSNANEVHSTSANSGQVDSAVGNQQNSENANSMEKENDGNPPRRLLPEYAPVRSYINYNVPMLEPCVYEHELEYEPGESLPQSSWRAPSWMAGEAGPSWKTAEEQSTSNPSYWIEEPGPSSTAARSIWDEYLENQNQMEQNSSDILTAELLGGNGESQQSPKRLKMSSSASSILINSLKSKKNKAKDSEGANGEKGKKKEKKNGNGRDSSEKALMKAGNGDMNKKHASSSNGKSHTKGEGHRNKLKPEVKSKSIGTGSNNGSIESHGNKRSDHHRTQDQHKKHAHKESNKIKSEAPSSSSARPSVDKFSTFREKYAELTRICQENNVPLPDLSKEPPPVPGQHNFIPDLSGVEDPEARISLIFKSLEKTVNAYFTVKDEYDAFNKDLEKKRAKKIKLEKRKKREERKAEKNEEKKEKLRKRKRDADKEKKEK